MMALSQTETRKYLTKFYRFLKVGHTFEFRPMRGIHGVIWLKDEPRSDDQVVIELDYRRDLISTLLHEFIHYAYPEWSESDVLRMESQFVNSLTDRQVRNIIKRFAEAI